MSSQALFDYCAKQNNITPEQARYILERSDAIMPIMEKQYGNDIDTICMKMREYQRIMIKNFQESKN